MLCAVHLRLLSVTYAVFNEKTLVGIRSEEDHAGTENLAPVEP